MSGISQSAQFVRATAIHPYSFHIANADDLRADIITTILPVRTRHQSFSRGIQVSATSHSVGNFFGTDCPVQPVGAQHEYVPRLHLDLIHIYFDE